MNTNVNSPITALMLGISLLTVNSILSFPVDASAADQVSLGNADGLDNGYNPDEQDKPGHDDHDDEDDHGDDHDDEDDHGDEGDHGDEEEGLIELSRSQMAAANISVGTLWLQNVPDQLSAPGEVLSDAYSNWKVSVRTPSLVKARHIALGSRVKENDPIATLFSEEMAVAQSSFLVARDEWVRVQALGKAVTGNPRFIQAEQSYLATKAKLNILGMSASSLNKIDSTGFVPSMGEYVLTAPTEGIVLNDSFVQGAWVETGTELAELTNERQLWIEAKIPASLGETITAGESALIESDGGEFTARVIQQAHIVDHETRTRVIRLIVENPDEKLHPGHFVNVKFNLSSGGPALAVPETALMRSQDGDWQVFVEEDTGQFRAQEVAIVRKTSSLTVIEGIDAGSRIALTGAFFLASEQAKAGFDIHGH
ncbi:efflux RND transporter periplasmic adaptor subunit [Kordiimonas lipolytica]|uniref:Efflux RND transporter periplasmic adaptor subunit n=1 Tax=Kordiimonas lipolytica TaxID=1662421 RepID=A0ABV8UFX3_9PROT|nr:efflux RND transporter periplasmic adaptor subunit [Kordiimonas lipolytica]